MVPPQNVTVNVSQDAFLACQAEAYPGNLTYTWFQGSSNVFHLRYGKACASGAGAAVALQSLELSALGWLGAWCPPGAVGTVPAVPLTASFPRSRLQARVRVLVDGSLLLQRTTPDDAGKYTCIPSNGLWKPPSASAFVTVLCKSLVSPGHAVSGPGGATGTPVPCRPHAGSGALFVRADPARVTAMLPETHLPKGMRGVIRCPTSANPPLLSVSWTRDGRPLELDKVPPLTRVPASPPS